MAGHELTRLLNQACLTIYHWILEGIEKSALACFYCIKMHPQIREKLFKVRCCFASYGHYLFFAILYATANT